jgi:outer membrane protein assembly factor BamD (BamD/ComL family)
MCPTGRNDTRERPRRLPSGPALLAVVIVLVGVAGGVEVKPADLEEFTTALEKPDDEAALSAGQSVFAALRRKYAGDAGFRALESRLTAAEFLGVQMRQQLTRAADTRLATVVGKLPDERDRTSAAGLITLAPAKRFYEASVKTFASPVTISGLEEQEKEFLTRYYDLKLASLIAAVARAGQALAVAEPGFTGTYDYVLVVPLLHASEERPLNLDVLPPWMQEPETLRRLSDSCLFHFESPFQAMVVARKAAARQGAMFSPFDFYRSAAQRCGSGQARVAVDCLMRAMRQVPADQVDPAVALRFDVVWVWLDSANYQLAAGQARAIFEKYPRHASAGKAIWLYYYALSRNNSAQEILTDIDQALADERCRPYEPKLMYIKWWALRRQRNQGARVAAMEYDLLQRYADDPMIAPILLSRATDLLASQSYREAREVLQQLTQKFPATQAAAQARRMLEKVKPSPQKK